MSESRQWPGGGGSCDVTCAWWPIREWEWLRGSYGGSWLVHIKADPFVNRNFGAVVDDFGNLVPVEMPEVMA